MRMTNVSTFPSCRTSFARVFVSGLLALMASCGGQGDEKKGDSGGDHIPDDMVYTVVAIPSGAEGAGLTAHAANAKPFLRSYVHTSERYDICLDPAAFDDAALTALQDAVRLHAGSSRTFGLEGIVNRALASVDKFKPGSTPASSRIEIHLVRPAGGVCHLLITQATAQAFPFNVSHYHDLDRVLLYVNQLRTEAGVQNKTPVAYLASSLNGASLAAAAQYMIGSFLGLGASTLSGSKLNPATTAGDANRGYLVEDGDGRPRFDDDAQIVFSFALLYRGFVSSADLATFQHFGDQLRTGDEVQDNDLVLPESVENLPFVDAWGDPYIEGARAVGAKVGVCVQNVSGVAIADDRIRTYLAFATPESEGALMGILHAREEALVTRAALVSTSCNLVVAFRNADQYPFASNQVNGLYAREGSLRAKSGATTTLPVIYLNAANLELDPNALASSNKSVALVLQHEFAHYLGFRHSASSQSLLAPAGYNSAWDLAGGDERIFEAYLKLWRTVQN